VKISWNGATKQTQEAIMLGSNWEIKLANIKTFLAVRNTYATYKKNYCNVTLQLTFLETNANELADLVELGIKLGVDRIKGHHVWTHFDEIRHLSMRRDISAIRRWNKAVIAAERVAQTKRLPNGQQIKLENIYPLPENAKDNLTPTGACQFLGKEAWVATDGQFNPCCAPDPERRKLGYFGNLYETSLTNIWLSEAYLQLKKNYLTNKICQQCNMRNLRIADHQLAMEDLYAS
jgi:radical SAM protein with 4Fe4S-binding SPASM domain